MFDQVSYLTTQSLLHTSRDSARQASQLYDRLTGRHWLQDLKGLFGGGAQHLLDLGAIRATCRVLDAHAAGTRSIPLDRIMGSEDRTLDFDRDFHPLNPANRQRWINVAAAWLRGESLPPVDLIQVRDVYFVRDGHHRISVARAFGQREIDAEVTIWEVCPTR